MNWLGGGSKAFFFNKYFWIDLDTENSDKSEDCDAKESSVHAEDLGSSGSCSSNIVKNVEAE